MSAFQYKAVSSAGKSVKGIIEADNKAAALTSLKEKGLYPTKLSRVRERRAKSGGSSFRLLYQKIFRRVSPKALAGSVRQLATLLTAGMALDVALAAMLEGGVHLNSIKSFLKSVNGSARGCLLLRPWLSISMFLPLPL